MRAQFMELTAPRRCLALNSLSANRALTMSYVIIISLGKRQTRFEPNDTYLTIVECTFDCNVVDIGVCHCSHLCLLDRRNTTFRVKNEDGDVGFVSETVYRSTFFFSIMSIEQEPNQKKCESIHTSLCRHL